MEKEDIHLNDLQRMALRCGKKREGEEEKCGNCRNEKWEPGLV
jgi:hypothetical protein